MKCATCNETTGCEHIQPAANMEKFQEVLVERSERAVGVPEPTQIYVPGKRDYTAAPKAGESRGPSVILSHGPAGPEGKTGATGLPGRDGVSPSVDQVVGAARSAMEERLADFEAGVQMMLRVALQRAGAIDQSGKAILIAGPAGRDGASIKGDRGSDGVSIKGDRGADGISVKGDPGKDGRDGDISEAMRAAKEYVTKAIADLVIMDLGRMMVDTMKEKKFLDADGKVVRGERGEMGAPGVRGGSGDISAALANMEKLLDQRLAAFREEIKGGVS